MDKKRILFMIGINEMAEHKEVFLAAVQNRIDLLKEKSDKLDTDICLYPQDRNEWQKLNPELSAELFELLEKAAAEGFKLTGIDVAEGAKAAEAYDAYYGSPSFMPLLFCGNNKPVMIADLEI